MILPKLRRLSSGRLVAPDEPIATQVVILCKVQEPVPIQAKVLLGNSHVVKHQSVCIGFSAELVAATVILRLHDGRDRPDSTRRGRHRLLLTVAYAER